MYEATLGLYEDLTSLGKYDTREEALQALGEWFTRSENHRIQFPYAMVEWVEDED
jgi:hypothetical protein